MQTNVQIDSNAAHHIKHRDHLTIEVSIFPPYFIINKCVWSRKRAIISNWIATLSLIGYLGVYWSVAWIPMLPFASYEIYCCYVWSNRHDTTTHHIWGNVHFYEHCAIARVHCSFTTHSMNSILERNSCVWVASWGLFYLADLDLFYRSRFRECHWKWVSPIRTIVINDKSKRVTCFSSHILHPTDNRCWEKYKTIPSQPFNEIVAKQMST